MKKIIYLLSLIMLTVTACDPLEDTYNELDNMPRVTPFTLTLGDAQYQLLPSSSAPYKQLYFATDEEAKIHIPSILDLLYSDYDDGASATVNYTVAGNVVSSRTTYTVTPEDYVALGFSNSRIAVTNGDNDIFAFLNYKYPAPENNQLVLLNYTAYNSNVSSTAFPVTDSFYFVNGKWFNAYHVTPADYTSTNMGRFNNYTAASRPFLGDYFNRFLTASVAGGKTGDVFYVSYLFFDNTVSPSVNQQQVMAMYFNGTRWIPVTSNATITSSQGFVRTDGKWIVDPTINYALVTADYVTISTIETVGTATNRGNLGSFKNFNISPSGPTVWSDAEVNAALAAFLKIKFPEAERDAHFRVTYYAYRSGSYSYPIKVFKKESSGEFIFVK